MEKEELEVLIEIRDFFRRHKQEIAKELGESDNALREALKDVKDTSYYSITELKRQIVEQSEAFKDIINEERDAFIDVSNTMKTQFDKQVKAYPSIAERLDDMAEMPHKLDVLVNKMEQYNWQLVENVNNMIRRIDQALLVNRLLGEERVMVSDIAGTTRDDFIIAEVPTWVDSASPISIEGGKLYLNVKQPGFSLSIR